MLLKCVFIVLIKPVSTCLTIVTMACANVHGTEYYGQMIELVKSIDESCTDCANIIVFTDNLTTIQTQFLPIRNVVIKNPQGTKRFSCNTVKTQLPHLLAAMQDVYSNVLWIDADSRVSPYANLDHLTGLMNNRQKICFVEESTNSYKNNWYRLGLSGSTYVKPNGINSGVFLVNMDRWNKTYIPYTQRELGDQDIFNEYFANRMDELCFLPHRYNYRGSAVSGRISDVQIHHGNGGMWKKPSFFSRAT